MAVFEDLLFKKHNHAKDIIELKDNGKINYEYYNELIDQYMTARFPIFNIGKQYCDENCFDIIRNCLTGRINRREFLLAFHLSDEYHSEKFETIIDYINESLEQCGTDYFDFIVIDPCNINRFRWYDDRNIFYLLNMLKEQGKYRQLAFQPNDNMSPDEFFELTEQFRNNVGEVSTFFLTSCLPNEETIPNNENDNSCLFEGIVEGLKEAINFEKGNPSPGTIVHRVSTDDKTSSISEKDLTRLIEEEM